MRPCRHENLSLDHLRIQVSLNRVAHSCDPRTTAETWKVGTAEFHQVFTPASLVDTGSSSRRSCLKQDRRHSCTNTHTHIEDSSNAQTHIHTQIHHTCKHIQTDTHIIHIHTTNKQIKESRARHSAACPSYQISGWVGVGETKYHLRAVCARIQSKCQLHVGCPTDAQGCS